MKNVLKLKDSSKPAESKLKDDVLELYMDYVGDDGYVYKHNGKEYYKTNISLQGPKGNPGPKGRDGLTPNIGLNGNWYIGGKDTLVKAALNTDEYVTKEELEDVIGNVPETLDTLKELADSLGNDANFAINVNNSINGLNEKVNNIQSALPKYDPANGHEYIDLGLPSGTKWATMNVGASSETDYGNYYQYGKGAAQYAATSGDSNYGGTEDPLDSSVDTASQVWGGSWHMPTRAQMQELIANTTYQWVTNYKGSGINGGTFTATNGAVLFFPAAGGWYGGSQYDVGNGGSYWGSSPNGSSFAYSLYFSNGNEGVSDYYRKYGYSVRGVLDKDDAESETFVPVASKDDVDELKENLTFTETTYSELKTLRDNGELTKGKLYRITDYVTTTIQENTQSANHPFDVIVLALSENKLSEQAFAIEHEGDTYFQNANLGAWELKYCLDNDTNRFAWADPTNGKGVIYYMKDEFGNECPYDFKNIQYVFIQGFTITYQTWEIRTKVYGRNEANDQTIDGTTYYSWIKVAEPSSGGENLPDEYYTTTLTLSTTMDRYTISNEVATKDTRGKIDSVESENFDTFTFDSQGTDASLNVSSKTVYGNVILRYIVSDKIALNKIFARANYTLTYYNNTFGNSCYGNTFGNGCKNNTFGDNCSNNTFGNYCSSNTLSQSCGGNTFGNNCASNTFGNNCYNNMFGNNCVSNTFGNNCYDNTFGNNCASNTFGNNCHDNTFGNSFQKSKFGNNCYNNMFGNDCIIITFGNECINNTFGNSTQSPQSYFQNIIFENGNRHINLTCSQTTSGSNQCRNILVSLGVNNSNTAKTITIDAVNQTNRTVVRAAADTEITV